MQYIFNIIFYNPLYNILVGLIDIIPTHDVGIAVILTTLVVSLLLFSISKQAIKQQLRMKEIEPELARIRETIKDKTAQSAAILELYRKNKINPLSSIVVTLIQIPILLALYYVFYKGGLPGIHAETLYSFVKIPSVVNMNFLGLLDIRNKSIAMAIIAGICQFIQAQFITPLGSSGGANGQKGFADDFARSMSLQMKYVFPFIIILIGVSLPSALPLYWASRSLFMALQEIVVRGHRKFKVR